MSNLRHIPSQTLPPFDEMVRMAERDPEAFEQFRHEMAKEMIESASEDMKERLWAQQSHIDRVISTCKNPHHTNVVYCLSCFSRFIALAISSNNSK
ncbi:DUF3135 domain-containing protein [Vibrio alginolyticus]